MVDARSPGRDANERGSTAADSEKPRRRDPEHARVHDPRIDVGIHADERSGGASRDTHLSRRRRAQEIAKRVLHESLQTGISPHPGAVGRLKVV